MKGSSLLFKISVFLLGIFFFSCPVAYTVIIATAVKLNFTIEDGDMQQAIITQAKFNGEEIDLSKKSFMHRKVSKSFNVPAGQYTIEWTTEKNEKPWGGAKEVKQHSRIIVVELTDAVIYINLRGENLTTY